MNVYDFDKTIYAGDCTLDFWRYCVHQYPRALISLPPALVAGAAHKCGLCSKEKFKEIFYRFLRYVADIEGTVHCFWDAHFSRMNAWYLNQRKDDDLIISASPDFLISEICTRLHVRYIASKVNPLTGKLEGKNCFGLEKVARLTAEYPKEKIEQFYSDSKTDKPLAHVAARAFLVKNGCIADWSF